MDITRNWRLKTSRSQLLATRCPDCGEVVLPQQTASANKQVELFTFEQPRAGEREDFAHAAR